MKLFDIKRPKKTKKEMEAETRPIEVGDQERYPYGSRLDFQKEEIEKIPFLQDAKADAKVKIVAEAFVKEVAVTDVSEKSGRRPRHRVEIQIEKIGIEPLVKKNLAEMDNEEYREARKG